MRDGCALQELEKGDIHHRLTTSGGTVLARFVIGADGAGGVTARLGGWSHEKRAIAAVEWEVWVPPAAMDRLQHEVRFDFDAIPTGYGWCFPKADHLSIGVGALTRHDGKSMKQHCLQYLNALGITEVLRQESHGFVIPYQPRAAMAADRIFLAGDAARLADAATAEGISQALYSGQQVAEALLGAYMQAPQAQRTNQDLSDREFMPQWKAATQRANMVYHNRRLSQWVLRIFGHRLAESAAAVFMGERLYTEGHPLGLRAWRRRLLG